MNYILKDKNIACYFLPAQVCVLPAKLPRVDLSLNDVNTLCQNTGLAASLATKDQQGSTFTSVHDIVFNLYRETFDNLLNSKYITKAFHTTKIQ